ncbi:hypothetical protein LS684_04315 [Cytobacillus spongiae]|uniref:hypothetical protein n=1 Tax=Cytobacillus spongiae TaxID=2901381 RepID=UPI001F1B4E6C|nr:hypothetical protein [Cytobacillus spongiae]UII56695.1 hypothetical protein LS684_04315 [Cytobacillus spongiae]
MKHRKNEMVWNQKIGIYTLPKREVKNITFSECGEVAYGKASDFKNADEFIKEVNEQYHEEMCEVENVRIESCISTLEGIGAEMIVPISSTDIVIENYFVADVSEIGIAGSERG